MHKLEIVFTKDLRLNQRDTKVLFDTTSLAGFEAWMNDKLKRSYQWPYFRFQCALEIRDLWTRNMAGREIEKALAHAKEKALPTQSAIQLLQDRIGGHKKGIAGLSKSLSAPCSDESQFKRREETLREKQVFFLVLWIIFVPEQKNPKDCS